MFKGFFCQFQHEETLKFISAKTILDKKIKRCQISANGSDNLQSISAVKEGPWDKKHVFWI